MMKSQIVFLLFLWFELCLLIFASPVPTTKIGGEISREKTLPRLISSRSTAQTNGNTSLCRYVRARDLSSANIFASKSRLSHREEPPSPTQTPLLAEPNGLDEYKGTIDPLESGSGPILLPRGRWELHVHWLTSSPGVTISLGAGSYIINGPMLTSLTYPATRACPLLNIRADEGIYTLQKNIIDLDEGLVRQAAADFTLPEPVKTKGVLVPRETPSPSADSLQLANPQAQAGIIGYIELIDDPDEFFGTILPLQFRSSPFNLPLGKWQLRCQWLTNSPNVYLSVAENDWQDPTVVEHFLKYPETETVQLVSVTSTQTPYIVHTMVYDANGELVEDTAHASVFWWLVTQ